jgi:hypothetical protein
VSKVILSRKGFDASYGGAPSPILPDGRLLSLPIPCVHSPMTYDDLYLDGHPMGQMVEDLTQGRIHRDRCAHLDPDLRPGICPRLKGWRPIFGQAGAAQAHLAGQGVGAGDLFLFFGWFRQVELVQARYRYVKGAPDLHVVYGWLRVGEVLDLAHQPYCAQVSAICGESGPWLAVSRGAPRSTLCAPPWAMYHPHCQWHGTGENALYVAAHSDGLGDAEGGAIEHYDERLRLSAPGESRSFWRLPAWFHPRGRTPLSYHADPDRWTGLDDGHVLLRTAARGQEFVLDATQYPEALAWAHALIGEVA